MRLQIELEIDSTKDPHVEHTVAWVALAKALSEVIIKGASRADVGEGAHRIGHVTKVMTVREMICNQGRQNDIG